MYNFCSFFTIKFYSKVWGFSKTFISVLGPYMSRAGQLNLQGPDRSRVGPECYLCTVLLKLLPLRAGSSTLSTRVVANTTPTRFSKPRQLHL